MMDDLGASFGLEAFLPGGDERSMGDDFARGVDTTDVSEDLVGDRVFG